MSQRFSTTATRSLRKRPVVRALVVSTAFFGWLGLLAPAAVQAGEDSVLERLLLAGSDFRVRARAAAALARSRSPHAGAALEAALIDRHPAVRQAAATALGQMRAASALPALRASVRDPVPDVAKHARESIAIIERTQRIAGRDARTKHYGLFVGELRDRNTQADPALLEHVSSSLGRELGELSGAEIVQADASPRDIPMYRIDGLVLEIAPAAAPDQISTFASVILWLTDEANQTMQIVFKGAATAIEEPDPHAVDQVDRVTRLALQRAVRAALRNANDAISDGLVASKKSRR